MRNEPQRRVAMPERELSLPLRVSEFILFACPKRTEPRETTPRVRALRVRVWRLGFSRGLPVLTKRRVHPCTRRFAPFQPPATAAQGPQGAGPWRANRRLVVSLRTPTVFCHIEIRAFSVPSGQRPTSLCLRKEKLCKRKSVWEQDNWGGCRTITGKYGEVVGVTGWRFRKGLSYCERSFEAVSRLKRRRSLVTGTGRAGMPSAETLHGG